MTTETDSIRACSAEARETVILTKQFYSCVVKDPRTVSGEFKAVRPAPIPKEAIEGVKEAEVAEETIPALLNVPNGRHHP